VCGRFGASWSKVRLGMRSWVTEACAVSCPAVQVARGDCLRRTFAHPRPRPRGPRGAPPPPPPPHTSPLQQHRRQRARTSRCPCADRPLSVRDLRPAHLALASRRATDADSAHRFAPSTGRMGGSLGQISSRTSASHLARTHNVQDNSIGYRTELRYRKRGEEMFASFSPHLPRQRASEGGRGSAVRASATQVV
jgi:hypothetical protein